MNQEVSMSPEATTTKPAARPKYKELYETQVSINKMDRAYYEGLVRTLREVIEGLSQPLHKRVWLTIKEIFTCA